MKSLTDEIKLTIELMQGDIDDGAHGELQSHLCSLLEIKRNELQQRLTKRSWLEPVTHGQAPYKSVKLDGQITEESKPLTTEELMEGGWWCADTSDYALKAFLSLGLKDHGYTPWDGSYYACFLYERGLNLLDRGYEEHTAELKQIHLIGNQFFWSDDK